MRRKFESDEERRLARKEYLKNYRENNKEKISRSGKNYYQDNKEDILTREKNYYKDNKEKLLLRSNDYYKNNKDKKRTYQKNKLKTDNIFKIKNYLRVRLYHAIRGDQKAGSAVRDLGCSVPNAKLYWENLFYTKVDQLEMTWDNWGKVWQLHHIKPFESFDNLSDHNQVREVCHYTNQKPLYTEDHYKEHEELKMLRKIA
jgi:hypothetical protein